MSPPLIAVIEDEEHLAQGLIFNLRAEGYATHHETDGAAALRWLLSPPTDTAARPAAILLDVMLPGADGFTITRTLREHKRYVPILLLTARGRTEDVIEGFEAGADDYLPKPFDLNVLLARLHSLLRRKQWLGDASTEPPAAPNSPGGADVVAGTKPHLLQLGERTVDFDNLEIRGGEQPVRLTVMEADLLRYLAERPGRVISRKELLQEVWRVHGDTDTRPIDNFIVRLRRYLEVQPSDPIHLLTVRGVGYRFAGPS